MDTLRELGPDVWTFEGVVALPGVRLPARSTVIRLADGGLLLHSPLAIDDALQDALTALGPVRTIVAPNKLHHLFVKKAQARFPEAKTFGAPGLADKRPDITFDGVLGQGEPFVDEVATVLIEGMPALNEVALLHRASRTLVLTDLLFNVVHSDHLGTRLLLKWVSGVYGQLALSRLVRWSTKDRAAAAASVARILGWAPTRLVVAHGDPIDEDVPAQLERALAWLSR